MDSEYSIIWTPRAYETLRQAHDFIEQNAPGRAKKMVAELVALSMKLGFMPRRHPLEPNLSDAPVEYRFLLKGHYKIIYTVLEQEKMVLVVSVFDVRQNPKKMVV